MGNNLHSACHSGNLPSVKYYLTKENIDELDYCNGHIMTPLMIACYRGHEHVFDYLIKEGADISIKNNSGDSALTTAIMGNNCELAKKLITISEETKKSLNLNQALQEACRNILPDMCLYLLEKGAVFPGNELFESVLKDDLKSINELIDLETEKFITVLELVCRLNKIELLKRICEERKKKRN